MFDFDSAKHYVLIFTLLSICRDKVKGHLYWQWVKKYWSYSCSCHTFTHNNDRSWPWSVGYCLTYLDSALLCLCYLIAYLLALLMLFNSIFTCLVNPIHLAVCPDLAKFRPFGHDDNIKGSFGQNFKPTLAN